MDNHPQRPDNAQFWVLSDIVLRNDADAVEGGREGFMKAVHRTGVLLDNLSYMSAQRCARMVEQTVHGEGRAKREARQRVFVQAQSAWIDGFVTGAEFGRRQAAAKKKED